jgi:tetratricopeptide (TPR) repeat protein
MIRKRITIFTAAIICLGLTNTAPAAKEKGSEKEKGGTAGVNNFNAGNKNFEEKQYPQAIAEYSRAIELNPKQPAFYENRGYAYLAMQRLDEANNDFTKAIELAPKDDRAYLGRVQVYLQQRQYDLAAADADKAIEVKPDNASAYTFRGFSNVGLQQWDKAAADFTTAIQKNPNDWQNYDQRALAYRTLKNYEPAIADYTAAIEKNPNASTTGLGSVAMEYARRGYTYALMTQYEKAIADYQQALKLDPSDVDTPMRLQYAQSMLAQRNAPPPTTPAPTPEPKASWLTPLNIVLAVVILGIVAAVIRLVTRGKPEEISSSRIR